MKLKISGKEYDVEAGVSKVTLQTLYELKTKYGVSMKTMVEASKRFEGIRDPMAILDDDELFQTFLVMIWLARKHAGENVTLEESSSFPLDQLEMPDDEPEPATDPKELTGSGPDDEPEQEYLPTT